MNGRIRGELMWLAAHLGGRPLERSLSGARRRDREAVRAQLTGGLQPVDRHPGPPAQAWFHRTHVVPGRPVVLAGLARDWPAARWTPASLAQRYPEETFGITDYGEEQDISLEELFQTLADDRRERSSRFGKLVQNHPELHGDLDLPLLRSLVSGHHTSLQCFMGPQGAFTPLHAGGTANLHVQLHGRKRWYLIEPALARAVDPQLTHSPLLTAHYDPRPGHHDHTLPTWVADLEPGDVLYVPTYFWHAVEYTSDSIAAGMRIWNPIDVLRRSPTMFLVMATARNPTVFEYYLDILRGQMNRFYGSRQPDALVR